MNDYIRHRRGDEGEEGFFCRFTFGQFFAILVLEVLTLFFVFYLGARYGREFLGMDERPRAEVAPAPEAAGESTEEPRVLTTADPEAAKLAKELMAKAETPELKERIGKMFEQAQQGGRLPQVIEKNRAAETGEAAQAAAAEPQPEAPQSPEPAPMTQEAPAADAAKAQPAQQPSSPQPKQPADAGVVRVKSVENARYSVQVGSYPKLDEATRMVEKWKGKGYPAYMMIADIPDRGRWYRVRIGGFATREDASRYMAEFAAREGVEALVVMNEQ